MAQRLCVSRDLRPGTVTLRIVGDLDIASAAELSAAVESLELDDHLLVLDVGGVDFVDSSGLRALLRAHSWSEQHRRRMVLAGLQGQLLRLLDLTDTASLFELRPEGSSDAATECVSPDVLEPSAAPEPCSGERSPYSQGFGLEPSGDPRRVVLNGPLW
ncbi:MAG: STAS domain-containing protein, partial [Actinomycetota bacterium]